MTVKGSREFQYEVVRRRPYIRPVLSVLVLVAILASAASFYFYGLHLGRANEKQIKSEAAMLKQELNLVRESEKEARQTLENAKLGAEVDRSALEDVRLEISSLKEQIALLEEDNQFYRNLMAPSENQKGLNFGAVEIIDTDLPRTYRFKVVMQQLATQHQLLTGSLNFNIVGRQALQPAVLALSDVSSDVDSANIKLRFKYFQNIEGSLVLPEDFEPERIELEARATKPKNTVVEKRLAWLVQE